MDIRRGAEGDAAREHDQEAGTGSRGKKARTRTRARDKLPPTASLEPYKAAVRQLRQFPGETPLAWAKPSRYPVTGILFRFCTPDGLPWIFKDGSHAGDPLMVAKGPWVAWGEGFDAEAKALGLPASIDEIEDCHLVKLARFQRKLDETVRRQEWRHEHAPLCREAWPPDRWIAGSGA